MIGQFVVLDQKVRVSSDNDSIARVISGNLGAFATDMPLPAPDLEYTIAGNGPYKVYRRGTQPQSRRPTGVTCFTRSKRTSSSSCNAETPACSFSTQAQSPGRAGRASWSPNRAAGNRPRRGRCCTMATTISATKLRRSRSTRRVCSHTRVRCAEATAAAFLPLPAETMRLSWSLHVPTGALPARVMTESCPLDAIFLLRHDGAAREPSLRPITAAEATARLFVHSLNALAHPNMGLDAVLHIASHARCFDLTTARLPETCELIDSVLKGRAPHI